MSSGTTKRKLSINKQDYKPKRLGLIFVPPRIVIEYLIPSTNKLYHHKIKLDEMISKASIESCMKYIYEGHADYLEHKKITKDCIKKLLEKLASKENKRNEPDYETDPQKYIDYYRDFDLNKLTETELEEHKKKMEKIYLKNAVLPGDKDFVYDKQVDFNTEKYDAEWDDDEEEEAEEVEDEEADDSNYF